MNRIYAFFHGSEAHPCAFPPQFSLASLHLAVLLQLNEESICGEAAGEVGGARPKETSPVPLPSPPLTLFSYRVREFKHYVHGKRKGQIHVENFSK